MSVEEVVETVREAASEELVCRMGAEKTYLVAEFEEEMVAYQKLHKDFNLL